MQSLDISHVASRTQKRMGWSNSYTTLILKEYLRYLTIAQTHPDIHLVPSELVDEIWHDHILHTKRYMADCQTLFGRYMHHLPETDPVAIAEGSKPDIKKTLELYVEVFGEAAPREIWGVAAGSQECTAGCKSGSGVW